MALIRLCLFLVAVPILHLMQADEWKGDKLAGHTGHVRAVAYSPDGKYLLSAGAKKQMFLWDLATGTQVRSFATEQNLIVAATFSADGKWIGTADGAFEHHIFETATGNEGVKFPKMVGLPIFNCAFAPDGKTMATAGEDTTVRIWDTATGQELKKLCGHTTIVACVRFSPDGKRLVSSSTDRTVRVWDLVTNQEIRLLKGHTLGVIWVEFSPDGRSILSACHDGSVRLWEVATGKERLLCAGHKSWVRVARFSPDGKAMVSVGEDHTARVWDAMTGKELRTFEKHKGMVWCAAWSPDGKTVVSGGDDNMIYFYDVRGILDAAKSTSAKLIDKELEGLWAELNNADVAKAYQAIGKLAADPSQSIPFLAAILAKSAPSVDPKKVAMLLIDLDADDFSTREKASAELSTMGKAVEIDLRQHLGKSGSLEVDKRLQSLLEAIPADAADQDVGIIRAVEALERIGDASARAALKKLAKEAGNPVLKREAEASWRRLER